jgi:hypothetical protein
MFHCLEAVSKLEGIAFWRQFGAEHSLAVDHRDAIIEGDRRFPSASIQRPWVILKLGTVAGSEIPPMRMRTS